MARIFGLLSWHLERTWYSLLIALYLCIVLIKNGQTIHILYTWATFSERIPYSCWLMCINNNQAKLNQNWHFTFSPTPTCTIYVWQNQEQHQQSPTEWSLVLYGKEIDILSQRASCWSISKWWTFFCFWVHFFVKGSSNTVWEI